jgi:hypothetical protein
MQSVVFGNQGRVGALVGEQALASAQRGELLRNRIVAP